MSDVRTDSPARLIGIAALILVVAVSRLLPHPPNFSPVEAVALFAGAMYANRAVAVLVPLLAMLVADAFLGFHSGMWVVYGCIAVIALAGRGLGRQARALPVIAYGLGAAVFFFLVTNFVVWLGDGLYSRDWSGLVACYTAAIPFFHNQIAGALFFSAVLFGAHALWQRQRGLVAAA